MPSDRAAARVSGLTATLKTAVALFSIVSLTSLRVLCPWAQEQ
jgi:hypothetical protein